MADNESSLEWELAGYLEAGGDFNDDYHNFDANSEGSRIEVETFSDWDFLPDTDYVVVHYIDNETGDEGYATIAGPFDDYEDFEAAIAEWYEEGS